MNSTIIEIAAWVLLQCPIYNCTADYTKIMATNLTEFQCIKIAEHYSAPPLHKYFLHICIGPNGQYIEHKK